MFSFNIALLCSFFISAKLPHYKYFAALQHLSGSAAKIFIEIMVISKNKPCRGEIFVNILYIGVGNRLENILGTPMISQNLNLTIL